jgi:calmodulin-regulated spectrin-associated protein
MCTSFVSGPGSLPPGLMTKRRVFDDGCSDISSTPSSMLEYTGQHSDQGGA